MPAARAGLAHDARGHREVAGHQGEAPCAGLQVKGTEGAFLRPRRVEWSEIRGMRRPRRTQVLVLELASGRELQLPQLTGEDTEGLAAEITARLGDRIGG